METQRLNVTTERQPDGKLEATVSFYALSLIGIRESENRLSQDASYTFAFGDEEEHQEGLKQCEIKWPTNQGWTHLVAYKPITLRMELIEKVS